MPGAPTSSLVAAIMSNTAAPPTLQQQHHQHQLQQQQQQQSRLAESTSVYVSGLPRDIDEKDLGTSRPCMCFFPHRPALRVSQSPCCVSSGLAEALFSPQGTVKKIKVYKGPDGLKKGDALVTYHRADAAAAACIQVLVAVASLALALAPCLPACGSHRLSQLLVAFCGLWTATHRGRCPSTRAGSIITSTSGTGT
jgi:hypothetical protein